MTTFIFTGKSSNLSTYYNPPIYLEEDCDYELALINFDSFYSIPNIDGKNNTIMWWDEKGSKQITSIPEGAYEITNISETILTEMNKLDAKAYFRIVLNPVTSTANVRANRRISFNIKNSIGSVLGFTDETIDADKSADGGKPVNILKVNAICVDCNIVGGSFLNGKPVHIIHQFFPSISPGYKIVESPSEPIYHPVVIKAITNITVRLVDQDGNLLNFRDDIRTVRLHLRKINI